MGVKISNLPSATVPLTGSELVPVVQGGTTVQAPVFNMFSGATGAAYIGFTQSGTGATTRTTENKLRDTVSVKDFGAVGDGVTNDTAAIQASFDACWAERKDVFIPGGTYLVTGLTLPGTYPTLDQRDHAIRIYGQGYGNPYSNINTGGTVLKSVTDAPIITDRVIGSANGQGTYEIDHIRFDGTSTTPVVLFNGFYGTSSFHNNVIYQRGVGDGLKIVYGGGGWIYNTFAQNSAFATFGLGAARTGIGFNFPQAYDAGLISFTKCSSRGWLTAYSIADSGAGVAYSTNLNECECSVVYNGVILGANARNCSVSNSYFEGGDGGIGVKNSGNYNVIAHNLMFSGFSKLIEDISTTNMGSNINNNALSIGAVVNGIGVDIQSSAGFGGYGKNVIGNSFIYTAGTNGVNGIKISGTDPRLNLIGNAFDPRPEWTGTSTTKINDSSSNGVFGLTMKANADIELTTLSRGAVSFAAPATALTQTAVTANVLTIPDAGSNFVVSATVAATVLKFISGTTSGRFVIFRTTTANMTFSNGAYVKLAGGVSFTGPGTITFLIDRLGADNYAWELSRTTF